MICKKCSTQFEPLWQDARDQANGCACEILRIDGNCYLLGYYGSKYDGQLWEVPKEAVLSGGGPICDSCVELMLNAWTLTRVPGEYSFGVDTPINLGVWSEIVKLQKDNERLSGDFERLVRDYDDLRQEVKDLRLRFKGLI